MNLHEQNARVIDAAADRIFERGWFALGREVSGMYDAECASMAICMAALDDNAEVAAMMVVAEAVGEDVATWNDAQPDADTVIAKLRECADAERAKAWAAVPA